jgi:lysophospholipase
MRLYSLLAGLVSSGILNANGEHTTLCDFLPSSLWGNWADRGHLSDIANPLDDVAFDTSSFSNFEMDVAAAGYLAKRALGDAPNGYTPADINCPTVRPQIRSAATISPSEEKWLKNRRLNIVDPLRDLLKRLDISGLDTNAYIDSHKDDLPNIGIAMSGGGYRALLNGAGVISAFDSRTANSTSKGHVGGLLQSATYLSGLSGGSWLVGSLYMNNFTSVQNILSTPPKQSLTGGLWQFANTILQGKG